MQWQVVMGLVLGLLAADVAHADVPGPRNVCDVEGLECQACWRSFGGSPEDEAQFSACAQPLRDKGWAEQCSHRQGAGNQVYFCPQGVAPKTVTRGGGCGACEIAAAPSAAVTGLAFGLIAIGVVRRSRRRGARAASSPPPADS